MASVACWIRSYTHEDTISVEKTYQHFIASRRGLIAVGDAREESQPFPEYAPIQSPFSDHWTFHWTNRALPLNVPYDYTAKKLGFNYWWDRVDDPYGYHAGREFIVCYWMLSTTFAITPFVCVFRRVVHRRGREAGCCQRWGYDLRATRSRCPECGTVPAE